jgi:peptidoglycan/LPS O-acetylase OafA/YrhL
MDPLQVFIILAALLVAAGGGVMLYRGSRDPEASARGPYVPLAMMAIGLMIAYRVYSDFGTLEPIDLVIMGLFVFGLMSLLGLQFFIVDKNKRGK